MHQIESGRPGRHALRTPASLGKVGRVKVTWPQKRDNIPKASGIDLVLTMKTPSWDVDTPRADQTVLVVVVDHVTDEPRHEHNPQRPCAQWRRQMGEVGLVAEEDLETEEEVPF